MSLTTARKPLNLAIFCLMVFLCVIWGAQQVALKYTVPDMPPVTQLAFRFCGAAFVFLVLMLKSEGRHAFADGNVRSGLFVGALFAVEFLLLAESLKYTTAAHSVVFLYTAPVFAALGLHVFPEERLSLVQWLGIAVAVLGIAVAFFDGSEPKTASMLLGDGLALSGGMMWGASTVALRRSKLASVSATKAVFYQVLMGGLVLAAYAWGTSQLHWVLTPRLIVNLVFQTLVIAVLTYLTWFWMIRHYLTSRLMLMALMTPLFGVLFGALLLHESVDARFAIGALFVLGGIAIVNGVEFWRSRR